MNTHSQARSQKSCCFCESSLLLLLMCCCRCWCCWHTAPGASYVLTLTHSAACLTHTSATAGQSLTQSLPLCAHSVVWCCALMCCAQLLSVLLFVFSIVRYSLRRVYDALMFCAIVRPRARVPAIDTFIARFVSARERLTYVLRLTYVHSGYSHSLAQYQTAQ